MEISCNYQWNPSLSNLCISKFSNPSVFLACAAEPGNAPQRISPCGIAICNSSKPSFDCVGV